MPRACHHGPTSSHATTFYAYLLFLLLPFFLTTIAVAGDSAGSKADTRAPNPDI